MSTQPSLRYRLNNRIPKILLIVLLLLAGLYVAFLIWSSQQVDLVLGERLYKEGILASGEPLRATTQSDITFSGSQFSCVNCHRASGYGSSEGGNYVLPITGPLLFQKRDLDRADIFKKLFKEYQPKRFKARMRMPQMRPAYTEESLARVLREGIDPTGRRLDLLMPRYELPDQDMNNLIAYLKQLGVEQDPGVDADKLYFATVISDKINPDKRRAMLDTMQKFVEWMNLDTQGDLRNPNFSPHYRTEFIKSYRLWDLQVWELKGKPNTWARQLADYYSKHPVFAVISGMVDGSWRQVQKFCESEKIPCLFPHTKLPGLTEPPVYSVFFTRGLSLEAEVISQYLQRKTDDAESVQIIQLHDSGLSGTIPADRLRTTLRDFKRFQIDDRAFSGTEALYAELERILASDSDPDTLIIWPGEHANSAMEWIANNPKLAETVFLPSDALEDQYQNWPAQHNDYLFFSYPNELPQAYHPRAFRVRAWMNTRKLDITDQRLQFNTYYALTMLQYGLEHIIDNFSRDYLLEYIEHEAENALNPGTYPRLSLGPGQRFASRGAYVVKLDMDSQHKIVPVSDWIVP